MRNSPCYNVTRSKLTHLMVFRHEAVEFGIAQHRAFTPQRLGEKKAWRFLHVQRCGMELHKLHVTDLSAGAECHGNSVSRSHRWICGIAVHAARASRSQQHGGTAYRMQ